jgi:hypothetical protein
MPRVPRIPHISRLLTFPSASNGVHPRFSFLPARKVAEACGRLRKVKKFKTSVGKSKPMSALSPEDNPNRSQTF